MIFHRNWYESEHIPIVLSIIASILEVEIKLVQ